MSRILVDELQEHTSGAGIAIPSKVTIANGLIVPNVDITSPIPEVFAIGPVTATVTDPAGGSFQIKMSYDGYGELNLQGWTGTSGLLTLSQIGGLLAGGTVASPSYPLDNSWLFSIVAGGWDSVSSRYLQGSRLLFATLGDWSSTNRGAAMELWTTKQNTAGNPTLAISAKADSFALFPREDVTVNGDTIGFGGEVFRIGPIFITHSGFNTTQTQLVLDTFGQLDIIGFDNSSDGSSVPGFNGYLANGTSTTPSAPLAGLFMSVFGAFGWTGQSNVIWREAGYLAFLTTENWSETNIGTKLICRLAPTGGGTTLAVKWETTDSAFKLFPNGDLTVDSDVETSVFDIGPITDTFTGDNSAQRKVSYLSSGLYLYIWQNDSASANVGFNTRFANGTVAAPTYPTTGFVIANFSAAGWFSRDSIWSTASNLQTDVPANWSDTNVAGRVTLWVSAADPDAPTLQKIFVAIAESFSLIVPAITKASSATAAGLRVPHGTAPSSPVDGDVWTTTAGLFVRINGVTVGPLT